MDLEMDLQKLIDKALASGASAAKVVDVATVKQGRGRAGNASSAAPIMAKPCAARLTRRITKQRSDFCANIKRELSCSTPCSLTRPALLILNAPLCS